MFSFIKTVFRRFLQRSQRRDIFVFHDGDRWRSVDPLVAWRIMWSTDGHLLPERIAAGDNGDWRSIEELTDMACRMFGVRRFEHGKGGMTIDEINSLLADYMLWMTRIKKKRDRLQTQLQRMGSASNSAMENSTTKAESGSFSTPSESKSDEPPKPSKRSFVHSGQAIK